QNNRAETPGKLLVGKIVDRIGLCVQRLLLRVSHYSNDFAHPHSFFSVGRPGLDSFADYLLTWKVFARESLVDHQDRWGFVVVSFAEVSPLQERNPHRVEVARSHDRHIGIRPFWGRSRVLLDVERY